MTKQSSTILYVGTFTRPAPYLASAKGEGIYVYHFNPQTGALTYLSETHGIDSPSFLTVDPQRKFLYANSEIWGWDEGLVKAYAIDPEDGSLTYLNMQPSQGSLTSYISVEASNRYALVTNYESGSVVVFAIKDDGSLSPVISKIQHQGSGPDVDRQEGPHTHYIAMDPTNTYALVTDLGVDKVFSYRLDLSNGQLLPHHELVLSPGSGPRHLVFHPNGHYIYVINELNSTISALTYDSENGALELIETVSTLPDKFDGHSHTSDIQITPSGKFLYGANRGHDSLVIYAVNEENGRLTYVGHQLTQGKTPRNFAIDPTGTFLLVANQDSDTIVTFRINQETGQLEETGQVVDVPTPVCLKFM